MKKGETKHELLKQGHIQDRVKEKAYLIAESEGFPHGRDIIHWLRAEEEIVVEFLGKQLKTATDAAKNMTAKAAAKTTRVKAAITKPATKPDAKAAAKSAPKPAAKPAAKVKPAGRTAAPSTNGKAKKATNSKPAKKA